METQATTVVVRPKTPKRRCAICRTIYQDGAEPVTDGYCETCEPLVDDVYRETVALLAGDYAGALVETREDVEPYLRAGRRFRYALRAFEERYLYEIKKLRAAARPLSFAVIGRDEDGVVRYVETAKDGEPWDEEEAGRRLVDLRRKLRKERLRWSIHSITEGEAG